MNKAIQKNQGVGWKIPATLAFFAITLGAGAANLRVPESFPSIQEAVNAAPSGDSIHVSGGPYDAQSLTISGTDLRLYAWPPGAIVEIHVAPGFDPDFPGNPRFGSVRIENGASAEWHEFHFTGEISWQYLVDCQESAVTFVRCRFDPLSAVYAAFNSQNCSPVRFYECSVFGSGGEEIYPLSSMAWPGAQISGASIVWIQDSEFYGGDGTAGGFTWTPEPGSPGANALDLANCASATLIRTTTQGGNGGAGGGPTHLGDAAPSGNGGDGVSASGATHLYLSALHAIGGEGGNGFIPGVDGLPVRLAADSTSATHALSPTP